MNDILDSLGEGIFTVDKEFRITFVNRAAEQMLGVKREAQKKRYSRFFRRVRDEIKQESMKFYQQNALGTKGTT